MDEELSYEDYVGKLLAGIEEASACLEAKDLPELVEVLCRSLENVTQDRDRYLINGLVNELSIILLGRNSYALDPRVVCTEQAVDESGAPITDDNGIPVTICEYEASGKSELFPILQFSALDAVDGLVKGCLASNKNMAQIRVAKWMTDAGMTRSATARTLDKWAEERLEIYDRASKVSYCEIDCDFRLQMVGIVQAGDWSRSDLERLVSDCIRPRITALARHEGIRQRHSKKREK